ncbi:hypothetical protein AAD018_000465 [Aestuariibius insulae]|uniref:hypothetical protein n=1 Tax=Aestuariibius insulae TaxID=2058287 RepID=UPI00345E201C
MRHSFFGLVMGCVLALTGGGPALADNSDMSDVLRFLVDRVEAQRQEDARRAEARRERERRNHRDRRHRNDNDDDDDDDDDDGGDRRARHGGDRLPYALPARCLRSFDRQVRGQVFMARCLRERGVRVGQLPRYCEVRVRTRNGDRRAFRQGCLRNVGFYISRR